MGAFKKPTLVERVRLFVNAWRTTNGEWWPSGGVILSGITNARYNEAQALDDILKGKAEKAFGTNKIYKNRACQQEYPDSLPRVIYRTQKGTIADVYNSESTKCCTLYPNGMYRSAAALQVLDPHMVAIFGIGLMGSGKEKRPDGVLYGFLGIGEKGVRRFIVDSVEGDTHGLPKGWAHDFYEVAYAFAQDNGCTEMQVNEDVSTPTSHDFVGHVSARKLPCDTRFVRKIGGTEVIGRYGTEKHYLECFSRMINGTGLRRQPDGQVDLVEFNVRDSWAQPEGEVTGYLVHIKPKK